jgi:hypothetical protein
MFKHRPSPMPMPRHPILSGFILWLLLPCLVACRSLAPLPPADLSQPGWQLRHGQALWLPSFQGTEVAGDLLLASRSDGHALLEFTKASWPIVLVHLTSKSWRLEAGSTGQRYSGRGPPPARSAWLVLPRCLAGEPAPAGWSFTPDTEEGWELTHHRTGEQIRGYFLP